MSKLTDDEAIQAISIVLAAYSEHFPQLRGKAVRPDVRDDARQAFARQLIQRLKLSGISLWKEPIEDYAPKNELWKTKGL